MTESVATQFMVVDYIIIGLVVVSALFGLLRGFMREVIALVSWIVAFWLAFQFGPALAIWLEPHISVPSLRQGAAYAGLFIGVLIVGGLAGYFLARLIYATGIGGTDRVLGLVFGALRGLVIVLIAILLGGMTVLREDPWWQQSVSIQYLEPWAQKLREMLPEEFKAYLGGEPAPAPGTQAPAQPAPAPQSPPAPAPAPKK
ncbi:MAG: CvpA family protein [Nevskiales bacterium]